MKNKKIKNPKEFYAQCVEHFHNYASSFNINNKGVIFIPELLIIGNKVVVDLLKNDNIKAQILFNVDVYYYIINALVFKFGIVFASSWHEDYGNLNNDYVNEVLNNGPSSYIYHILKDILKINKNREIDENDFLYGLYEEWINNINPYLHLSDPRDYIVKAYLAIFQLGIYILFERYGY